MDNSFMSMPEQLETKIEEWKAVMGKNLSVDYVTSYTGHKVYALTLTAAQASGNKQAHYFAQPHAHEPATTAGMIDVIEQLVTGSDLWGNPAAFDVERALATSILTFNPIGNPYGRAKSPVAYWDGSRYTNNELACTMRGEDPEQPGVMWKRLALWDVRDVKAPEPVGIVYEPIDAFRYVEPNRSHLSSFFRLFHQMNQLHDYKSWLDLHQQEFDDSADTCEILLPLECGVPQAIKDSNAEWAEEISNAWRQEGFSVCAPHQIPYAGEQAKFLSDAWGDIYRSINVVYTEIKNNGNDFRPELQMRAQSLAVVTSIKRWIRGQ